MARIIYPRAQVSIAGVVDGEEYTARVLCESVSIHETPHTHASMAEVTLFSSSLPFRGRQLQGLVAAIYLGDAGAANGQVVEPRDPRRNLRFVGNIDQRTRDEGGGPRVKLSLRDLSAPLRDAKPVPLVALPRYSDTVMQALQRILDAVPGVSDQLTIREDVSTSPILAQQLASATGRRSANGYLPLPKTDATAWTAIATVCDAAAALVDVRLDELVVARPSDAYGEPGQPEAIPVAATFILGGLGTNAASFSDRQKFVTNRKGIRAVSYDPEQRRSIEVVYPPDSGLPPVRLPRAVTGNPPAPKPRRTTRPRAQRPPERDTITAFGISSPARLLEYARRLWAERALNEVTADISTPLMDEQFLALRFGDLVVVKLDVDIQAELRRLPDERGRIEFLRRRLHVSEDAARLLAAQADRSNGEFFRVRSVTKTASHTGQPEVKAELISIFVFET